MASLDISLKDIPQEGLAHTSQVTCADLDLREDDPRFLGPLDYSATIHASEHEAWVSGNLRGTLLQECVRCLGEFKNISDIPVEAYYRDQGASTDKEKSKNKKDRDPETDTEEVDSHLILNDHYHYHHLHQTP